MLQRQMHTEFLTCPDCGSKLSSERDLLICSEHGAFFTYGPQLLVRAPRPATKLAEASMPWEAPRSPGIESSLSRY